jgi:hydrogenase maturation protease
MCYKKTTCIVAIGNTLRGDDMAGDYVSNKLAEKKLPFVDVICVQQLDIGMAEDLSKFDRVIFVDASLTEKTFSFKPLNLENNPTQTFSHQVNASILAKLIQQLFPSQTAFYICAIGATNFEMGNGLSETTQNNANAAIAWLTEWLQINV